MSAETHLPVPFKKTQKPFSKDEEVTKIASSNSFALDTTNSLTLSTVKGDETLPFQVCLDEIKFPDNNRNDNEETNCDEDTHSSNFVNKAFDDISSNTSINDQCTNTILSTHSPPPSFPLSHSASHPASGDLLLTSINNQSANTVHFSHSPAPSSLSSFSALHTESGNEDTDHLPVQYSQPSRDYRDNFYSNNHVVDSSDTDSLEEALPNGSLASSLATNRTRHSGRSDVSRLLINSLVTQRGRRNNKVFHIVVRNLCKTYEREDKLKKPTRIVSPSRRLIVEQSPCYDMHIPIACEQKPSMTFFSSSSSSSSSSSFTSCSSLSSSFSSPSSPPLFDSMILPSQSLLSQYSSTLLPSSSQRHDDDLRFEVKNGLLGMMRDLIFLLCGVIGRRNSVPYKENDQCIRVLLGMVEEQYLWRKHCYFQEIRRQLIPIPARLCESLGLVYYPSFYYLLCNPPPISCQFDVYPESGGYHGNGNNNGNDPDDGDGGNGDGNDDDEKSDDDESEGVDDDNQTHRSLYLDYVVRPKWDRCVCCSMRISFLHERDNLFIGVAETGDDWGDTYVGNVGGWSLDFWRNAINQYKYRPCGVEPKESTTTVYPDLKDALVTMEVDTAAGYLAYSVNDVRLPFKIRIIKSKPVYIWISASGSPRVASVRLYRRCCPTSTSTSTSTFKPG